MSKRCEDARCDRERGHDGLHMSRSWDSRNCTEVVDEWGSLPPITQKLLDEMDRLRGPGPESLGLPEPLIRPAGPGEFRDRVPWKKP